MKQRNLMLIAEGLTAFILVMVGGVAAIQLPKEAAAPAESSVALAAPVVAEQGANGRISTVLAATIAKNVAPGAVQQKSPELVLFEGTEAYEVVTDLGNVYVDATTGEVLNNGTAAAMMGYGEEEEYEEDEHGEEDDD